MTMTMTNSSPKHLRQPGKDNDGHAPWPPRCDQCRKVNGSSNSIIISAVPLPRRRSSGNGGGARRRQRQRTTFASYLIAALTIASAALSSMGKSKGAPLNAMAAAAPLHSVSTRRGYLIGSVVATLLLSKEAAVDSVSYPAASTAAAAKDVPFTLFEMDAHHVLMNGAAALAEEKEEEELTRLLQSAGDTGADHVESEGIDVNNIAEEEENLPWGQVIGATFLVSLATFSGLIIVAAGSAYRCFLKLRGKNDVPPDSAAASSGLKDICIFAFAAGALTATAVFLVLPEALHLIGGEHEAEHAHEDGVRRYLNEEGQDDKENVAAAKFGCAIMGGFLLPQLFGIVFHRPAAIEEGNSVISEGDAGCPSCIERDGAVETGVLVTMEQTELELVSGGGGGATDSETDLIRKDETYDCPPQDRNEHCDICNEDHNAAIVPIQESVPSVEKVFINKQLCASILLGDGFHNFSDGMFIAASFKASCDVSTSVSIVMVTIIHEIAQELADFILLTRHVGLSVPKALLLNFLSGLSVVLGGIIFLAGNPSDEATGIILGMAGGVYINIAACETLPRIESIIRTQIDRICALLFFIIGTIPIGVVLLNHHHCG